MIGLLDYGAGNLTSVRKALAHLGAEFFTPTHPVELDQASGIIVPGVGNFEATRALADGWTDAVRRQIERGVPLLGICLGLQWLFRGSSEAPGLEGLGLIPGECALIEEATHESTAGLFKVPHVGWNSLDVTRSSWLLDGINNGDQVYFTHSFAAPVTADCVASTTYGVTFASAVERHQVAGVQFHPEKSGNVGLRVLGNFLTRVGNLRR